MRARSPTTPSVTPSPLIVYPALVEIAPGQCGQARARACIVSPTKRGRDGPQPAAFPPAPVFRCVRRPKRIAADHRHLVGHLCHVGRAECLSADRRFSLSVPRSPNSSGRMGATPSGRSSRANLACCGHRPNRRLPVVRIAAGRRTGLGRGSRWFATAEADVGRNAGLRVVAGQRPSTPVQLYGRPRATAADGLIGDSVRSLLEVSGWKLVGRHPRRIEWLSPHRVTSIVNLGLVNSVGVSPDGSMWVGSAGGLIEFRGDQRRDQEVFQEIALTLLTAVDVDEHGNIGVDAERPVAEAEREGFVGWQVQAMSQIPLDRLGQARRLLALRPRPRPVSLERSASSRCRRYPTGARVRGRSRCTWIARRGPSLPGRNGGPRHRPRWHDLFGGLVGDVGDRDGPGRLSSHVVWRLWRHHALSRWPVLDAPTNRCLPGGFSWLASSTMSAGRCGSATGSGIIRILRGDSRSCGHKSDDVDSSQLLRHLRRAGTALLDGLASELPPGRATGASGS